MSQTQKRTAVLQARQIESLERRGEFGTGSGVQEVRGHDCVAFLLTVEMKERKVEDWRGAEGRNVLLPHAERGEAAESSEERTVYLLHRLHLIVDKRECGLDSRREIFQRADLCDIDGAQRSERRETRKHSLQTRDILGEEF